MSSDYFSRGGDPYRLLAIFGPIFAGLQRDIKRLANTKIRDDECAAVREIFRQIRPLAHSLILPYLPETASIPYRFDKLEELYVQWNAQGVGVEPDEARLVRAQRFRVTRRKLRRIAGSHARRVEQMPDRKLFRIIFEQLEIFCAEHGRRFVSTRRAYIKLLRGNPPLF